MCISLIFKDKTNLFTKNRVKRFSKTSLLSGKTISIKNRKSLVTVRINEKHTAYYPKEAGPWLLKS